MIKRITVNGQEYEIDTTPVSLLGRRKLFATVLGVRRRPASGVIAEFLREQGEEPTNITLVKLDENEASQVVLELGYKFSTSRAWQHTVTYYKHRDKFFNRPEEQPRC